MDLVKILLVYEDGEDIQHESVWATPFGDHFRIENIPFYATEVAYGDLVSVSKQEDELLFDGLIKASGHSVVQMMVFDEQDVESITQDLDSLGCTWEISHLPTYLAIDIPATVDYQTVQTYLEEKASQEKLGYREACLGFL